MTTDLTRKDFLLALTSAALLPTLAAQPRPGKILIFVAHPDDEYAFAAATYRLVRELGWTADQAIVTGGESGNRYSSLAEVYYGAGLTGGDGPSRLAAIRKQEVLAAGKILGIRQHHFLEQKDLGFDTVAATASSANWDRAAIRAFLDDLLEREQYDAIFTLLPTAQTHGHHRAATLLALDAVAALPASRPAIFGVETRELSAPAQRFDLVENMPLTATTTAEPFAIFDRSASFGYRKALSYQIVANWVVAEHKSQGLFQTEAGRCAIEEFWLFEASGPEATQRALNLRAQLDPRALY